MNRCCICNVTDDDNPQAKIALYNDEPMCHQCSEAVYINLEDLSINDEIAIDYTDEFVSEALVLDDDWIEAALSLPEVQE